MDEKIPDDPDAFARYLERKTADEHYDKVFGRKANGSGPYTDHGADQRDISEPLDLIDAANWHGQARPTREFLDGRKLFPFGYASILAGAGAVGKTLIALQASVACTAGLPWLGADIRTGPVLFYSAEEPIKEVHIRVDEICEAEGIPLTRLHGLFIIDLKTLGDASLITGDNKTGLVTTTNLFKRLEKTIEMIRPVVVFLDNRGLLITGNENDRTIASMAMRSLQLLAEKYQCSIILLAHPSLAGINSDSGSSGSTAWVNTARSVIYMKRPKGDDDKEVDNDERILVNNKANYSKHGTEVNLVWQFNRFVCTDPPIKIDDKVGRPDKARRVFTSLLRWHNTHHMRVSANKFSRQYAPKVFSSLSKEQREGLAFKDFDGALHALLDGGEVVSQQYGAPSDKTFELALKE